MSLVGRRTAECVVTHLTLHHFNVLFSGRRASCGTRRYRGAKSPPTNSSRVLGVRPVKAGARGEYVDAQVVKDAREGFRLLARPWMNPAAAGRPSARRSPRRLGRSSAGRLSATADSSPRPPPNTRNIVNNKRICSKLFLVFVDVYIVILNQLLLFRQSTIQKKGGGQI